MKIILILKTTHCTVLLLDIFACSFILIQNQHTLTDNAFNQECLHITWHYSITLCPSFLTMKFCTYYDATHHIILPTECKCCSTFPTMKN